MPDATFNRCVASGREQPDRDLRESIESSRLDGERFGFDLEQGLQIPDWLGYRIAAAFLWFWFSWMSFGLWAFVVGKFFLEGEVGEDAPPWGVEMYLGIPVAATIGGLLTFAITRGGRFRSWADDQ